MIVVSAAVTSIPAPPGAPAGAAEPDTVTWAPPKATDTLSKGAALSHVLDARGLDADQIGAFTRALRAYQDPRRLRPGTALRFALDSTGAPRRIRLALNPDSVVEFVRSESAWTTRLELVPFVTDTVRVSAFVESNLWSARLGGDLHRFRESEFEELVYDLADVFAWKVDFTRDLRKGDTVFLALERKVRPDGSIRSRHFLAIEVRNRGRILRAIPQTQPDGRYVYYDEEGKSLRGAFLRYPVPFRITSQFTRRRYHPVLKRYRAHQGIDYGAPSGTPVAATASGVVARAEFSGGYGRIVELRHAQGIRTRYAHLSSIASGIRPGAHVEQGQTVGRVGASGLATGPHLHYEFLQNGVNRNPLTVAMPTTAAIDAGRLASFRRERDDALALIEDIRLPDDLAIASNRPANGR
ncbi:MAG TPA: M23 family metallopeptidase [Candidatus Eisenbacteria bacterium]|nr:M23 family metallopeptidase [Candidatus Eisenbacteria bacterium]